MTESDEDAYPARGANQFRTLKSALNRIWHRVRLRQIPVKPGKVSITGEALDHPVLTRFLAVLLCFNDDDMLEPIIEHLKANHHDIVILNHESEDRTDEIARKYIGRGVIDYQIVDRKKVPFRYLYTVSGRYLWYRYRRSYDWLSFPDQDEILLGPDLSRSYHEQVTEVLQQGYDWVEFDNYVFWFTDEDDLSEKNPVIRMRYYNLHPKKRIRAWRFDMTNERKFGNTNPIPGKRVPVRWPLFHYPMRSLQQAKQRVLHDRNQRDFQFDGKNWHYEKYRAELSRLIIPAERLHYFDGQSLNRNISWNF